VEGEELCSSSRGSADGSGDGVGDVVEFEIQEDVEATASESGDDLRPLGNEKFEADFDPAAGLAEALREGERRGGVGEVQSDDEAVLGGLRRRMGQVCSSGK
jgi:hypothetical protein